MKSAEHFSSDSSIREQERASRYGIDLSLLFSNLKKTPLERIRIHDRAANEALKLRKAWKHTRAKI